MKFNNNKKYQPKSISAEMINHEMKQILCSGNLVEGKIFFYSSFSEWSRNRAKHYR